MARRDRWTNDFARVRTMTTPWPEPSEYIAGRNEAYKLSLQIGRLVADYKNNPGVKAPRNADMAYHMLAFRYGYNTSVSAAKKKITDQIHTGGLFAEVYEDPEMLKRYDSSELRTNKTMVEMGKAFAAMVDALPSETDRTYMLLGFRSGAEERNFNIYSGFPPDRRPPAILPLSEVKREKRPTSSVPPTRIINIEEEPKIVNVDDDEDPFGDTSSFSSSSSASSSVPVDTPSVSDKPTLILASRDFDNEFEQFNLPPPSVSGIPFQQDIIRHFVQYQQSVRQQNQNLTPTFFDMFHQKAVDLVEQNDMQVSDIVIKIIKMEIVKFYKVARDGIFAFIAGYGAGEEHHRLLKTTLDQISSLNTPNREAIVGVSPKLRPVLYQSGFMGAFNQFLLSWETNSDSVISIQDMYDADTATMFHRLQKKRIVVGVIKAVTGRAYPSDAAVRDDPNYPGFEYYIEAGIVSAINFLRRFVENKSDSPTQSNPMTYQMWASAFSIFFVGWHVYMTKKNASPTEHVESIKRKIMLVRNLQQFVPVYDKSWRSQYDAMDKKRLFKMKLPAGVANDNIGVRNAVAFITRLDPDYTYYAKINKEQTTSLELITAYIKERFGVNPVSGMAPLRGPQYLVVAWQTRAVQMFQVMPITNWMYRSMTGSFEKYIMNVLSNLESDAGKDYSMFYENLGEFALTFSDQAYKKLVTTQGGRLPSIQVLQNAFHNRMRYAVMIEHQVNEWLSYNRTMFDPTDVMYVWNTGQTFWTFDGHPIQGGNILSRIVDSAYMRKMNEERDNFLRRRKFLYEYGTLELPYIEKNYALLIEVITMAYMLTASLTEDDGEFLSELHTVVSNGGYDDPRKTQTKIDDMMNKFWLRRKTNYVYPWLPIEAQEGLADQLANIVITDEDRKFFRSSYTSSAITRLSIVDIASQIDDADTFRNLLTTVYLVEMYKNCNAFAAEIVKRNWANVITFGDVVNNQEFFEPSSKKSQQEIYDDAFTYFIVLQEAKNERTASVAQTTTDDVDFSEDGPVQGNEETNDDEEEIEPSAVPIRPAPVPEEAPTPKKTRPASSSSSSSQPSSSFFEPAFSVMRGKWYALMFEAEQLVKENVMVGPNRHTYADGEHLGTNFSQDLAAFVREKYPNDYTLVENYANVRAYAINQLSSIYNELENQKIAAAIIDGDFNNPISQQHEVEVVRTLLVITRPVAEQIYNFDGKKDVFMLGFVNGYENKTAEIMAGFEAIQPPEGGGRKVSSISAAISQMNINGTMADLVAQLSTMSDDEMNVDDIRAGRAAGATFVDGAIRYAKQNDVSYSTAVSRAYIDLENYYDKLMRKQSIAKFVQTGKFTKDAAKAIQQYPRNKVAFFQGFLMAMDDINNVRDISRNRVAFVNYHDELFNSDILIPNVDEIVAEASAVQHINELSFTGVGFTDVEFKEIIERLSGTIAIDSLELVDTSITNVEPAFTAFPNMRRFTSINNSITPYEFAVVFELPSTRAHLVGLNIEMHPSNNETLTNILRVLSDFLENSLVVRDVELELNLSTRNFAERNQLALSYLYNGLMKSSSIRTFYCQGVYPFRYDTIHQDSISKHLKKNRAAPISSRYPARHVSERKAREILHHGSVHGHPLTDAQRRFFGAMSHS